uniref:Uncharacterized protein n=1 Tax=Knipowitschia caucasica TaxID=637954 RepID=A0AAV2LY48_KNICA
MADPFPYRAELDLPVPQRRNSSPTPTKKEHRGPSRLKPPLGFPGPIPAPCSRVWERLECVRARSPCVRKTEVIDRLTQTGLRASHIVDKVAFGGKRKTGRSHRNGPDPKSKRGLREPTQSTCLKGDRLRLTDMPHLCSCLLIKILRLKPQSTPLAPTPGEFKGGQWACIASNKAIDITHGPATAFHHPPQWTRDANTPETDN